MYESPFTDLSPRGPDELFAATELDELLRVRDAVRACEAWEGGSTPSLSIGVRHAGLTAQVPRTLFAVGASVAAVLVVTVHVYTTIGLGRANKIDHDLAFRYYDPLWRENGASNHPVPSAACWRPRSA